MDFENGGWILKIRPNFKIKKGYGVFACIKHREKESMKKIKVVIISVIVLVSVTACRERSNIAKTETTIVESIFESSESKPETEIETEIITENKAENRMETETLNKNETVQAVEMMEEPSMMEATVGSNQTVAGITQEEETKLSEEKTAIAESFELQMEEIVVTQDSQSTPNLESGCINDGLFY